jgi:hypothetical protein
MTNQNEEWPKAGSRVERLTLFSDAIFAFAMTLLAVNIRVPEIAQDLVGSQLNVELANLAPKFIGYGLSFFISASYWVFYHRIFAYIKRYDLTLIWLDSIPKRSDRQIPLTRNFHRHLFNNDGCHRFRIKSDLAVCFKSSPPD